MTFIQAHLMAILSIWTLVHVAASSVSANCPPNTWYGKLAHVWCAINPLDVVKAFKAIGAELAVPLACICFGVLTSCKPAVLPEPEPLASARQAEHDASRALGACILATGVGDKLRGEGRIAIALDEIKLCWPDLGILVAAAAKLHAAEQAVIVSVPSGSGDAGVGDASGVGDAGGTTVTMTNVGE